MKIRVYLAGRYERREELRQHIGTLADAGFIVTSRWLMMTDTDERMAEIDRDDVLWSDALIFFAEEPGNWQRGGRHVEFGMILGWNYTHGQSRKHIIVVGPKENVFHHLPGIEHVNSFEEAVKRLKGE